MPTRQHVPRHRIRSPRRRRRPIDSAHLEVSTETPGMGPANLPPAAAVAVSHTPLQAKSPLVRLHVKAVLVTALLSTTTSPDHLHLEGTSP